MQRSERIAVRAMTEYFQMLSQNNSMAQMHLLGTGYIAELENKIKRHYGMKYALCLSNATTALMAVALALNLRNSHFVTTPYTYGASISGWMMNGNKPIFADIENETLSLDPQSAAKSISSKTKAILAVDIYGIPHDSAGMREVANEYGIWYIADCAQSMGATRSGRPSGIYADALVTSFTVGKTVFAGEGAAIVTNSAAIYEKLLWFSQHPLRQKRELGLLLNNEFGLNARIHPLAAVWANATWNNEMKKLAKHQRECYQIIELLNEIGLTENIPFTPDNINPSFFRLTACVKNKKDGKDALIKELNSCIDPLMIEDAPITPLYKQPAFIAQYKSNYFKQISCPQAERQAKIRICFIKKHMPVFYSEDLKND